jgi:deoxyribose-phosphate aldolase
MSMSTTLITAKSAFVPERIASSIQYTNVQANATRADIIRHCEVALEFGFDAVMLQPCWIPLSLDLLKNSSVKTATAVAYPMGGETTKMKVQLVSEAFHLGADELDFQPNIGFLRSGMFQEFEEEIRAVVEAAEGRSLKLMSEFGFLSHEEQIRCMRIAEDAGVSHVKNSSGVGPGGSPATPEVIRFMRSYLSPSTRIKASGGIKSYAQAVALLEAGADLLGSSAGPAIARGLAGSVEGY